MQDFQPIQSICEGDEEQSCKQLLAVRHKGQINIRKGFLIRMSTARGDPKEDIGLILGKDGRLTSKDEEKAEALMPFCLSFQY